jgi:hypothetical protein
MAIQTKVATKTKTEISAKVVTAVLLLAIAGSVYGVGANLIKRSSNFRIWSSGPSKADITAGYNRRLGNFDLKSSFDKTIFVSSITFNTKVKGRRNIRNKIENIRLIHEYPCTGYGYGPGSGGDRTCQRIISSAPGLDNEGRVKFNTFDMTLLNYDPSTKLVIYGDIANFTGPERKIMFYLKDKKDVDAFYWDWDIDPSYGYGYGYVRIRRDIYPDIRKAKTGTWLTISSGYGY